MTHTVTLTDAQLARLRDADPELASELVPPTNPPIYAGQFFTDADGDLHIALVDIPTNPTDRIHTAFFPAGRTVGSFTSDEWPSNGAIMSIRTPVRVSLTIEGPA